MERESNRLFEIQIIGWIVSPSTRHQPPFIPPPDHDFPAVRRNRARGKHLRSSRYRKEAVGSERIDDGQFYRLDHHKIQYDRQTVTDSHEPLKAWLGSKGVLPAAPTNRDETVKDVV